MIVALAYVGVSLAVLLLLTLLYVMEDIKGTRIVLPRLREAFDRALIFVQQKLRALLSFFTHGFMRLLLHYGAHTVLNRLLSALRTLEGRVEELVRKNRKLAKDIRTPKERNHLDAIAAHKEEVALSDEEREERLSQ